MHGTFLASILAQFPQRNLDIAYGKIYLLCL